MTSASDVRLDRFPSRWIFLIYFGSGVCSLIDEVVWVRLLKLVLGNTVYASSVVVSTFFGGLALGALIMSRYADRIRRPLRTYAILELCATVAALLLPFGLRLVDPVYGWLYRSYQTSPGTLLAAQVVLSASLLLIPTLVMGSTLPLLARYVTTLEARVGERVGRLYALNTLGAAVGTFTAGLVLIRTMGVMGALYVAAAINLLVAASGFVLSRSEDVDEAPEAPMRTPATPTPFEGSAASAWLVLCAAGASGLVSIGYELLWMRSVVFLLGGFTYVFSAVLTIYLLGNVIGVWIGSRLVKRVTSPGAAFGASLTVLGALGVAYLPLLAWWSNAHVELFPSLDVRATDAVALRPLGHALALFLVPSIAMGIGFPLALQAWTQHAHAVGRGTGTVYGVNTLGSVVGGIVIGFGLIPAFGVQHSFAVLALLGLWLGVILAFGSREGGVGRWIVGAGAAAATASLWLVPPGLFVDTVVAKPGTEVLAVREGATATVSVSKRRNRLALESDGVHVGADDYQRAAQQILGHLGVLLHGNAADVLSIGFGSGETTACLAKHDLDRIDCVEIEPEVVNLALEHFDHVNLGDALNEHVDMHFMDGKNFVRLTDRTYDVIVNGANIPSHSGSSPMFTAEHFAAGRDHLNPGGLFVTKLHILASRDEIESIIGTFAEVFPHVTIWFPATRPLTFLYLVGSSDPQTYSVAGIRETLALPEIRKNIGALGVRTEQDLFSSYVADDTDIARAIPTFHRNSDDTPFVEFNRNHAMSGVDDLLSDLVDAPRSRSIENHLDWRGLEASRAEWEATFEPRYQATGHLVRAYRQAEPVEILVDVEPGLEHDPQQRGLRKLEARALGSMRTFLAEQGPNALLAIAGELYDARPDLGTPWLLRSWALDAAGDPQGALDAARQAVELAPSSLGARRVLSRLLLARGDLVEATPHLKAATRFEPKTKTEARWQLAQALAAQERWRETLPHLEIIARLQPGNARARDLLERARQERASRANE